MKFYSNYPIQKKMISALIMCILLPMFFASFYISNYIVRLNRETQYSYDLNLLQQLSRDISDVAKSNMQFVYSGTNNGHIQAIIRGSADVLDYKKADEFLMSHINKEGVCEAIRISRGEDVKFQRGKKYVSEKVDKSHIDQAFSKGGKNGIWTEPHQLLAYNGYQELPSTVISFYINVYDFSALKPIGTISAHINEARLAKTYTDYLEGKSLEAMIVNEQGTIISSSDKSLIGHKSEWLEILREKKDMVGKDRSGGYLEIKRNGKSAALFYAKCEDTDWYLFNILPNYALAETGAGYALAGIVISILFGVTYAFIQKAYIINPLKQLSVRMEQVKQGRMEAKPMKSSGDEIGTIIKNFEDMLSQLNFWINQVYIEKIKTQEAEREALLAQMKPHFLYNTLDSIHWLALRNKDYEVSNQLEALSEIFKHVLNFGKEMITIEEEIEFINNYVYLMKARLHERFEIQIEVEKELYRYEVPKLIVQPLVENAIVHGLEKRENDGKIKIKIRQVNEEIEIIVLDNGVGCDQASIRRWMREERQVEKIFALGNIDERLKLRYGSEFGLSFYSKIGKGSMVKIKIPYKEEGNNALNDCR